MKHFQQFIETFCRISAQEREDLEALFEPVTIKKMDHVFTAGDSIRDLIYFDEGICRVYLIKDGEEFTTKFLTGPSIYAELFSIRNNTPTLINIQSINVTCYYRASFAKVEKMMQDSANLRKLFLKLYEHIYILGTKRQISFIKDSQTERYFKLLTEQPELLQTVPLQFIASFLGMKPETLSRIRKKMK
ncbi:Crp/Fnr family transcriptional regulator [Flavobacterium aurantiibacter]|uniref:Cyclic nucleotide-binding domain-containing protein n=1 Tax=Flavobacterium aurantiibacter TaxID=2023067 RepID=A0A256A4Q3_9FLAO|nr:Crp/Fnr family transcriptional regulator [Flavobacterium aurantiibacter]OYQ48629.1 hypothetical protein CHX27_02075 [Flavobacterium aurantiibacter]